MVALIVSPSTREIVSKSPRLRSNGMSSVNMVFLRWDALRDSNESQSLIFMLRLPVCSHVIGEGN
jgi:hypothetical protein